MALTKISSNVIANNTIAVGNIADNSVDATKIASNSILTRHIDDNQIGIDQLNVSDGSSGQFLKTNGSGTLSFASVSTPITALNNATANELVTVGSTTTELDAEANLTFDGTNLIVGSVASGSSTATPIELNLGSTFADAAGSKSKTKLKVFEDSSANIYGFGVSNGLLEYHSNSAHAFYVDESEKVRIDSSGNVAIGTGTTSGKFLVTDSSIMDINFIGNPPELNLEDSGSTSGQKRARLTLNDQQLKIQGLSDADDAVTSNFIACDLSNGNVGIGGSSTPAQAFEIYRNSSSGSAGGYAGLSLRNDHSSGYMAVQFHEGGTLRADILMQNGTNDMQFRVGGGGTERMRILSGGGLTFNGDTATANALDDYEEGTVANNYIYTSSGNLGTSGNLQTNKISYVKIGKMVHIHGQVGWTYNHGNTGSNARIDLPFTVETGHRGALALGLVTDMNLNTSDVMFTLVTEGAGTVAYFLTCIDSGTHDHLNGADFTSNSYRTVSFAGSYVTSQ